MIHRRVIVADILVLAAELCEGENIRVPVREKFKDRLIGVVAVICGGLLGGPIGMVIGGAVGGAIALATTREFKSFASIIMSDLSAAQREELAVSLTEVIPSQLLQTASRTLPVEVKRSIIAVVEQFISRHFHMHYRV
ncbi:protein C19orf12 homolog [Penaeus japonicus]|uniref:protein C19orf12 homolog n=1 Tax=Penaeus japonicus TaxID=27405 RepID=UPI001C713CEE|nr:protein C19orf12 homolog [Penaeus japonicus]XP_042886692.1 protein C19orf12 homolog [Penaeus japonicus]